MLVAQARPVMPRHAPSPANIMQTQQQHGMDGIAGRVVPLGPSAVSSPDDLTIPSFGTPSVPLADRARRGQG